MRRPKLLDLFCCEGGAGRGYDLAGFDVTGVDLLPRFAKRYPGRFVAADAIEYVYDHGHEYDAIHASPPCQRYTRGNAANDVSTKPDLIALTRMALASTGLPYVIENVADARPHLINPTLLCGTMFGLHATDDDDTPLEMWRHRLFESNISIATPGPCRHGWHSPQVAGSYGGARKDKDEARLVRKGGYVPAKHVQERLLGIDWMTQHGLHQSLPPAYTEHLGGLLLTHLGERAA